MSANIHFIGVPQQHAELPGADAIGFKAWNLARMAAIGLRVPPAFVLGTRHCAEAARLASSAAAGSASAGSTAHLPAGAHQLPEAVRGAWPGAMRALEQATGRRFGDSVRPLLVSVRSGAPVSMPGMMDTLLDIGLAETTLPGLLRLTGNPRLVWDAWRRLIASYGEVVMGLDAAVFERELLGLAADGDDRALDWDGLRQLASRSLAAYRSAAREPFPQDVNEQLERAIAAVYASWNSPRAIEYRRGHGIADAIGTAVTVQAMVFGNAGGASGAGVGFTRDPTTGAPGLWVDFLFNAQGEDVVSGRRSAHGHAALAQALPAVWAELEDGADQLEHALGDMQDIEFTVQEGKLWWLQTRNGKRTPLAAARIALDLCDAGVIDRAEALKRCEGFDESRLSIERVIGADGAALAPIAQAATASSGVAIGEIALDAEAARKRVAAGARVVLLRRDAETSDLVALELADGLLTARGARTAHAAVVARQLGKVCLVGCDTLVIDEQRRVITLGAREFAEGEVLTLDGNAGAIYAGAARTVRELDQPLWARLTALRRG